MFEPQSCSMATEAAASGEVKGGIQNTSSQSWGCGWGSSASVALSKFMSTAITTSILLLASHLFAVSMRAARVHCLPALTPWLCSAPLQLPSPWSPGEPARGWGQATGKAWGCRVLSLSAHPGFRNGSKDPLSAVHLTVKILRLKMWGRWVASFYSA